MNSVLWNSEIWETENNIHTIWGNPISAAVWAVLLNWENNWETTLSTSNNINTMIHSETKEHAEVIHGLWIEKLILKWYLAVGDDGKAYLTPLWAKTYVGKAIIPTWTPDNMMAPNVNPFWFKCIDGRYKLQDGFMDLPEAERVKTYPWTVPWGWAWVFMALIADLLELYGTAPHDQAIIKKVMGQVLEKNKEVNAENYKIHWHTDKHTEDHKAENSEHQHSFLCGCGFLTKAFTKNPDAVSKNSYGLTNDMIDFVQEILHDSNRTNSPEVLGATETYLENHDERAALLWVDFENVLENFTIKKQVNFSEFLSEKELAEIDAKEWQAWLDKLNIMVFTANFRAFAQKISQLSWYATSIIMKDPDALAWLKLTHEQRIFLARNWKYFVETDQKAKKYAIYSLLVQSGIKRIADFTVQIKQKIAEDVPVVTVKLNPDHDPLNSVSSLGKITSFAEAKPLEF